MKEFFFLFERCNALSCPCRHCHSKTTKEPGAGVSLYIPTVLLLSDWSDFEGAWAAVNHMIVQLRMFSGCVTPCGRINSALSGYINELLLKIDALLMRIPHPSLVHSNLSNNYILRACDNSARDQWRKSLSAILTSLHIEYYFLA